MSATESDRYSIDSETVEEASRFLAKVLRHEPNAYGVSLSPSGWAELDEVKQAFRRNFDESATELLRNIRGTDDENRFQFAHDSVFKGVRATRDHTADEVKLLELTPDESDLNWYLMEFEDRHPYSSLYVEATSAEAAQKVVERRLEYNTENTDVTELDKNISWNRDAHRSGSDSLSGMEPPHMLVHQSADKYVSVEKRANQGGDKGRYVRQQPKEVRSRLPDHK